MEVKEITSVEESVGKKEPFSDRPTSFQLDRRRILSWLGWGGVWLFLAGFAASTARFFFPRLLFEPPTKFKVGYPAEYPVGVISERYKNKYRLWVVREQNRIFVIEAKCTHLGCTPNWLESEGKFKCPCHGSGFNRDGVNIEGPAPRPLERFKVALADDGQIIVDKGVSFKGERGEWGKPGAYIEA